MNEFGIITFYSWSSCNGYRDGLCKGVLAEAGHGREVLAEAGHGREVLAESGHGSEVLAESGIDLSPSPRARAPAR